MRNLLLFVLCFFLLTGSTCSTVNRQTISNDEDLYHYNVNQYQELQEQGRYEEAAIWAEDNIPITIRVFGEKSPYVPLMNFMSAISYLEAHIYDKAINGLEKTYQLFQSADDDGSFDVGLQINNVIDRLSYAYYCVQDYKKSIQYGETYAECLKPAPGNYSNEYFSQLKWLAMLYKNDNCLDCATELYRNAIQYYNDNGVDSDLYYENEMRQYAASLADYNEAIPIISSIRDFVEKKYGHNSYQYSDLTNAYGYTYYLDGKDEQALKIFKDNLSNILSDKDLTRTAGVMAYSAIIDCYQGMKDFVNAEEYVIQALSTSKQIYGKNSPEYAKILSLYSSLLYDMGQYQKCIDTGEEAISILDNTENSGDIDYSNALLAIAYAKSALQSESISTYLANVEHEASLHGRESSSYAAALSVLGTQYFQEYQFEEAANCFREAYSVLSKNGDNEASNNCLILLGMSLNQLEQYDESNNALQSLAEGKDCSIENQISALGWMAKNYVMTYEDSQALQARRKIEQLYKEKGDSASVLYAEFLTDYAHDLLCIEDFDNIYKYSTKAIRLLSNQEQFPNILAEAYHIRAVSYNEKDYLKAVNDLDKSFEIFDRLPEDQYNQRTKKNILQQIATLFPDSEPEKRNQAYIDYISFVKQSYGPTSIEYAEASYEFAILLRAVEDFTRARQYSSISQSVYSIHPEMPEEQRKTLVLDGAIALHFDDYVQSEEEFLKALEISDALYGSNSEESISVLQDLNNLYYATGNRSKELEFLRKYDEAAQSLYGTTSYEYADVLLNLGRSKQAVLDLNGSVPYFLKSLDVYEALNDDDGILSSAMIVGETYCLQERFEEALALIKPVVERQTDYCIQLSVLDAMLACAYEYIGNPEMGKRYIENAKYTFSKSFDSNGTPIREYSHFFIPSYYEFSAYYYEKAGKEDKAFESLQDNLAATAKLNGGHSIEWASSKLRECAYYIYLRKYDDAVQSADDAFDSISDLYSYSFTSYPYYRYYQIYSRFFAGARQQKKVVSDILKTEYFQSEALMPQLTEKQRASFWQYHIDIKDLLFNLNSKDISTKHLYDYALLYKNILLNSKIDIISAIKNTNNDELINKYFTLTSDNHESSEEDEEDIMQVLSKQYGYKSKIRGTYRDVIKKLSKKEYSIEFIEYKAVTNPADSLEIYKYCALIGRKWWQKPKRVELCLKTDIAPLLENPSLICEEGSEESKLIADYIWNPILKHIKKNSTVYFSPDGILYQLPIEYAINDSQGRSMVRMSSTKAIDNLSNEIKCDKAVLYGGLYYDIDADVMIEQSNNYKARQNSQRGWDSNISRGDFTGWKFLSGTQKEIDDISTTLTTAGKQCRQYSTIYGNEESFKSLDGSESSIIHMATHGFYVSPDAQSSNPYITSVTTNNPEDAMLRSGLIMAGGNKAWLGGPIPDVEDGILTSAEISDMDLSKTEMVILSACETGLGDISNDGVIGLQRAFKQAGVHSIMMSLWKVDDFATELMMSCFYSNITSGQDRHTAFRNAQETVKEKYPEPYYWAGFIMLD